MGNEARVEASGAEELGGCKRFTGKCGLHTRIGWFAVPQQPDN
jgi:hypothetical protein